ncbi:hypothetical protein C3432_01990 [Citrobacter amalonaticus]|uniref:Type III secretion apparatus protein OrgA/MxiK n=2 Tax=Citrobacter amalonaticus TaxID=35703 RepID=A0A2S4S2M8_CITAM|nr:hypothetical protein C3432_01990 [Citrobacter amalonaticus]POT77647.1 hypothetical protein C3436_09660 [Citrobacter amalonaticus]POU68099.1 hypothetical protein C3430_03195 [Citrobacter amalonaticus]POV07703.1 hypothetical protein C3424_03205 [Citrobacter amalonaticus]
MRHYTTLIDIIYNPASYCDNSWLDFPGNPAADINALPAYLKNHLLLAHSERRALPENATEETQPVTLFIQNWNKIQRAAYMTGLKLFSAHILNAPLYMRKLTHKERAFLCLPLSFSVPVSNYVQTELSDEHITQAGANFIYSLAAEVLPSILIERLPLIFPSSFSFEKVSCGNPYRSLSALKWAFDYA